MTKSLRIVPFFLIFLFIVACGTPPQVTDQPVTNNNSVQQEETAANPTQNDPEQNSTQPAAEPSGLKVAFVANGDIWFWSETTPARQLTSDGDAGQVKLSDDGKVIVYTRGQSLWAINNDGTNPRQLVDLPAFTGRSFLAQFDFQPNTHSLYFSTRDSVQGSVGVDLHRVDSDSPTPQTLLQQGGQFTFSPDGRLLALADVSRINVLRTDSPALVSVLDFVQVNTYSDWSYYPQVVWLNNSTGFYTVIPASDPIAKPGQKSRFLYFSADGSFTAQLAEFAAADIRISQPLIAPNGSKVAYASQNDKTLEVHVIDASTADVIVASHPDALDLRLWAWSPDSVRFIYWITNPALPLSAGINLPSAPIVDSLTGHSLAWVDASRFLYISTDGQLRLGAVGNPTLAVIASGFTLTQDARYYDFAP